MNYFVKKRNIFKHRRKHQKIMNKIQKDNQNLDFIYNYEKEIDSLEKEKSTFNIKGDFIQIMKKAYVRYE